MQLGIDNNVDRIKGHHLWAHFKEIKRHDLRSSHASIIAWNDCVTECRQIAANTLLPSGKQVGSTIAGLSFSLIILSRFFVNFGSYH